MDKAGHFLLVSEERWHFEPFLLVSPIIQADTTASISETIMVLEEGQIVSVSPKHGQRRGQNEFIVYIGFDAASSMDRRAIFQ